MLKSMGPLAGMVKLPNLVPNVPNFANNKTSLNPQISALAINKEFQDFFFKNNRICLTVILGK